MSAGNIQIVDGEGKRIAPSKRDCLMAIIFDVDIRFMDKDEMQNHYDALAYFRENNLGRIKDMVEALIGPNNDPAKKSRKTRKSGN